MEYDVEIRPTKLIKGQGLAKLLVDSSCQALGLHLVEGQSVHEGLPIGQNNEHIYDEYVDSLWYGNSLFSVISALSS